MTDWESSNPLLLVNTILLGVITVLAGVVGKLAFKIYNGILTRIDRTERQTMACLTTLIAIAHEMKLPAAHLERLYAALEKEKPE